MAVYGLSHCEINTMPDRIMDSYRVYWEECILNRIPPLTRTEWKNEGCLTFEQSYRLKKKPVDHDAIVIDASGVDPKFQRRFL